MLSLAPRQQLLISGGRKGWISVLDLNLRSQRQTFQAHDSAVKALAVDSTEACFISGSSEGNIKVSRGEPGVPLTSVPFVKSWYVML